MRTPPPLGGSGPSRPPGPSGSPGPAAPRGPGGAAPRRFVFSHPLHEPRTAVVLGRVLAAAVAVCFVTGLVSHVLQQPPGWLADRLPGRPVSGYRVSQGLHVASGIAAVPLLLAKLWTVYPLLWQWPPVRSVRHALERLSVAVLVGAALFELASGLLNTAQWYPWPFSFVPVHHAVGWLLAGALLLHVAVKAPLVAAHWRRRRPDSLARERRSLLAGVGAAVGAVTVTTAGQSFTLLRRLDLLAPRHPGHGPQGVPVNRTAAAARIRPEAVAGWRLRVSGPRPFEVDLRELNALPQVQAVLPIACVEGWSVSARWGGVRIRDLLQRAGAPPGAGLRVVSMQRSGAYAVTEMGAAYARDPLTLLALRLNGEVLSPDHGFPARIIAPNRPGVLQTKWVARLEVTGP